MNQQDQNNKIQRRQFLQTMGIAAAGLAFTPLRSQADSETLGFDNGTRELIAYPQKRPLMLVTARPPHLETPFAAFKEGVLTPNDAFFVRYHLPNFPLSIDADQHRLNVTGLVNKPLSLSLKELKGLGNPVEVIAVNQCAGNSRGFAAPRVFGAQLGNGSMGNARWTGIPLKTVLEQAGVKAGAKQVTVRGLDHPVLPATPEFVKALDIDLALSGEPLIAWAMNGKDLPFLNGYPIKLIVPGYFGTYWIKHLSEIEVIDHSFEGFFMKNAYQVPDNDCLCVIAGVAPEKTRSITQLKIRSFITNLSEGQTVPLENTVALQGIAFDSGKGISTVEFSDDGGRQWQATSLGEDLGKYSFREWRATWKPQSKGKVALQVRARNRAGEEQPATNMWNPGGYARNTIETLAVIVV